MANSGEKKKPVTLKLTVTNFDRNILCDKLLVMETLLWCGFVIADKLERSSQSKLLIRYVSGFAFVRNFTFVSL